ncbi:MAG: hypothetical protein LBK26_04735 [Rickettsiales bacterium]|jgi:hypothetical protein|nr:hypothetical protein [Rickettsiales bacterium]
MSKLKKFWIVFFSFLPFTAGAIAPLAIGGIVAGVAVAGFSIYRSFAPVNMNDALSFFSSCWSCDIFGGIFRTLSEVLPKIYHSIGIVTIPIAVGLTAVWIAWTILAGFIGLKKPDFNLSEPGAAWSLSGKFGTHLIKLTLVCALLAFPLPRLLTTVFVEPVFNIGLAISNTASNITTSENANSFEACLVSTAINEALEHGSSGPGAFSPKLRHNLTCQLGGVHQMTGLGMTAGWTMLNMAFNSKYMHKFLWKIPMFPNMPLIMAGGMILILFFFALLPVPIYFLETIIKLSMDLVMLPLMLLAWLFEGWKILPEGGANLKGMVDRVLQNTIGIAMVGIFVVFSVMFINATFGQFRGADTLKLALQENDSTILMDGLLMNNTSLITVVLLGIFIAFFMTSIPALVKMLTQDNIKIPGEYYEKVSKDAKSLWESGKKFWTSMKK